MAGEPSTTPRARHGCKKKRADNMTGVAVNLNTRLDFAALSGGFFFVNRFGVTGKTFLWNAFTSAVRVNGEIVLNVASNGIAATLLPSDRTAHSSEGRIGLSHGGIADIEIPENLLIRSYVNPTGRIWRGGKNYWAPFHSMLRWEPIRQLIWFGEAREFEERRRSKAETILTESTIEVKLRPIIPSVAQNAEVIYSAHITEEHE
ncbi:hypothetical protein K1719_030357 [Acacia pycnantha]|nr:hypothetical protein K1719_030357 [Acacia pycnantha]